MARATTCTQWLLLAALLSSIGACGGGGEDEGGGNRAPLINGVPPPTALVDEPYSFRPAASDPDGDALSFSATGLPAWASFDAGTGQLSGIPQPGQEGEYQAIRISVSDGATSVALALFTIVVSEGGNGSASVSWLPPLENEDGTVLTDLSGYRIQYGRSRTELNRSLAIDNPSLTTYVVEQLSAGTWYFAVYAVNAHGIESVPSSIATKVVG